jgi:transcription factor WhiB
MTLGPFDPSRHHLKAPSAPLKVRPAAQPPWDEFHDALNEAHETGENLPNCDDKYDLYADNADKVSDSMARIMCGDCALLTLCAAYAERERPNSGIWAGRNYFRKDWEHD